MNTFERFQLKGKIAVITGGGGMLGQMHAEAIAEARGIPVLVDINHEAAHRAATLLQRRYGVPALGLRTDITNKKDVATLCRNLIARFKHIDILINNAANDPKVKKGKPLHSSTRFENFPLERWEKDMAVSLTGAFLCSQAFGRHMAERKQGAILNISSDLGIVAPDQRLYAVEGLTPDRQPAKPVSYCVAKIGLIGLTRYLATYWAHQGVRVNALCPGGVDTGQSAEFKKRIHSRIPMGRMARKDEYKGAVLFLVSEASSYMTGASVIMDGGRTVW